MIERMPCRITDGPSDPDQYEDWLKDLDRAADEEAFNDEQRKREQEEST
jgi:hypothetical protein